MGHKSFRIAMLIFLHGIVICSLSYIRACNERHEAMAPCFLDETIDKSMNHSPMSCRAQAITAHPYSRRKFYQAYLQEPTIPRNFSTYLANITILANHVGFHVDLSSAKNVMDYDPKSPHVNLKQGPVTL